MPLTQKTQEGTTEQMHCPNLERITFIGPKGWIFVLLETGYAKVIWVRLELCGIWTLIAKPRMGWCCRITYKSFILVRNVRLSGYALNN